ncbi:MULTISPECIES: PilZ domain-containing protein [unclassified Sphingobium]|uniref:PilZ domain-containing protein n=1 Tax=unclassified Sphingobium TaxID=2611147 RepID=UPI000D1729E8|nr:MULTISPECIES: PilZ domain-containing protein [unclassified Sphingobium]PSO12771.1 hypothetical protein C7E20_06630 [Sphingobium sp. AEW4]TWD09970.1 PilZ domain-containing protein [Sphingobium sp. AEW010]TWD26641.1 PilZ domain-containing protein [Sphingobium sp. AEW013]TWD27590.1 PilZ domain-containing protein [Sphingobium sp. AEW001]
MIHSKPALVWDGGTGGRRLCDWEERRRSGRTPASLHMVMVQSEHHEGLARLQNISDDGMMLRHRLPICLEDVITMQIANADSVEGTVVWTSRDACGVRLSLPIEKGGLPPQWAKGSCGGVIKRVGGTTADADAVQGEGKIPLVEMGAFDPDAGNAHTPGFVEGLPVKVVLGEGLERRGVLRWSKSGVASIHLTSDDN